MIIISMREKNFVKMANMVSPKRRDKHRILVPRVDEHRMALASKKYRVALANIEHDDNVTRRRCAVVCNESNGTCKESQTHDSRIEFQPHHPQHRSYSERDSERLSGSNLKRDACIGNV